MRLVFWLAAVVGLGWAVPTRGSAQILAARDTAVAFGHYHLHVTSASEHRKFWIDALGGQPSRSASVEMIAFPHVLIVLEETPPETGTPSTIDHIGFQVADLRSVVRRLMRAGYRLTTKADVNAMYTTTDDITFMPDQHLSAAFVLGPDNVKVEFIERVPLGMQAQTSAPPIDFDHVHFTATDYTGMRDWYIRTLGATVGNQTYQYKSLDLGGLRSVLQFSWPGLGAFGLFNGPGPSASPAPPTATPTTNHVVDHIGFEIRTIEAFWQRLGRDATRVVAPRQLQNPPLTSAFITDPWGTSIELTEGLHAIR